MDPDTGDSSGLSFTWHCAEKTSENLEDIVYGKGMAPNFVFPPAKYILKF
jgi:hypothetical protein